MIVLDDFEDGDVAEWTIDDGVFEADTSRALDTYAGHSTQGLNAAPEQSIYRPIGVSLQIDSFSFRWNETSNQSGFGLHLVNSNGNIELSVGSDNPEWMANGVQFDSGLDYNRWLEFEITFDWSSGEFTVKGKNSSGNTLSSTTKNLNHGVDIDRVALGSNPWNGDCSDVWIDNLSYTGVPKPNAPNNVQIDIEDGDTASVTWEEDTSGGPVDSYDVQLSTDGGTYQSVAFVGGSTTSHTETVSPQDDTFQFRVRANGTGGASNWSESALVSTNATGLQITDTRETEIDLSWDGGGAADDIEVLLAESAGVDVGDYSVASTVSSTSSATLTGLENGELYFARVRAVYSGADGTPTPLSNEVSTTTTLPDPQIDSLDASAEGEITANWTLNDNSTDGASYLALSFAGETDLIETPQIDANGAGQYSYTFSGLLDGREYTVQLARETAHVDSDVVSDTAQTILPRPTDLTVTDVRDDAADVRVEDNANNKQGYRAFAGEVSTFETQRDVDAWTVQSGLQRVSDRAYKGSSSAYAYKGDVTTESVPRASRVYHDGGEQIAAFEFYWQETNGSYGGGIRLKNSNGDYELGLATDNPSWTVDSSSGITNGVADSGDFSQDYNKWVRFLVTFDWGAGTFTFTGEDLDNGFTKRETFDLKEGVDIETVELWNYHRISGWGDSRLDMWWDGIATYTQNGGDLTPNEDSFETLRGWDVTHGSQVSDRVYDGSFSFFSGADGTGEQARYTITEEGEQLSKVTYYWQETSGSTGSGVRFVNSNGNYEMGVTSDNPEWDVDDANGPGQVYDPNDGYDHWVRFTVEFDWPNDQFSVDFESLASGETYAGVFDLKQGVDIQRIELWNYNGGWGKSSLTAWWDAFEFYDASGERLRPVHYTLSNLRNGEAYAARASVFTEDTEVFDS